MAGGSWLCSDDMDRERMLDMERRITPVRSAAMGLLGLALIACGPWLGWWTLLPLVLAALGFRIAEPRVDSARRPEYALFAAWAATEVAIAVAVALSGGPRTPTMAWFAIPVVTLSSRFSLRGVVAGVGFTLALLLAVAFATAAGPVYHDPTLLIAPAALVITVAMLSTALMRSDLEHRSEAVIDPLTGMLNRNALTARVAELTQQSVLSGEPIGLILADLDHFKQVNDSLGHATGDAVLKDVAYVLRKQLRAFDLAYRLGGEEFLVLLPGADAAQTCALAEELREAVACRSLGGGVEVTLSLGVSASERGEGFDYAEVFAQADAALYEAKRLGRDQVCSAGSYGGELSWLATS
jgi:diguanylate cyclase (GGDEF)-like protein